MEAVVDVEVGFAEFVRAQTQGLLRTAYLLTGSGSAAEELVQDTLVRLFGKWQLVQAADQPVAYVRRAMTNTYLNERRRASSREIRLEVVPERVDDADATKRVADRDELWPLLRALPSRQRAAIVLRYYSDLSDADVAAALDCRVGTVRSLISRGLASMREASDGATAGRTS